MCIAVPYWLVHAKHCYDAECAQRLTFLEGQPGIHAVKAAILHAQGDIKIALAEAEVFTSQCSLHPLPTSLILAKYDDGPRDYP